MKTVIRRPITKTCPYKNEPDHGELVITFDGEAPELHDLGARVDSLIEQPISHEEFTSYVRSYAEEAFEVRSTWQTGGWAVEVTA